MKIATCNITGLATKESELTRHLKEKSMNIAIITETKKKLNGTKDMDDFVMI